MDVVVHVCYHRYGWCGERCGTVNHGQSSWGMGSTPQLVAKEHNYAGQSVDFQGL